MAVILVADDEPAIRALMSKALQRAGHSVYTAGNGLEAVAVFRSYQDQIDLVVMDVVMPVMDGAQAVLRIRENRPSVPVICISGYNAVPVPPDTAFLPKPFLPSALVDKVSELLGDH